MNQTPVIEPVSSYVIRFQDCDPFGHLNNACYFNYLISAREDHLSQFYGLSMQSFLSQGIGWVIGQHEILYLKPARLYEKICIQTTLIGFSDHFVQVEAQMMDEDQKQLKALLWTKYHHVSIPTGKKTAHSPELIKLFSQIKNTSINSQAGIALRVSGLLNKSSASQTSIS
jgi:acyl-CoA thioester hydrolase